MIFGWKQIYIGAGDMNTSYFHKRANGRKRKMHIAALEQNDQILDTPEQLKEHITDYYKNMFGRAELADIHLEPDMWADDPRLYIFYRKRMACYTF